MGFFDHPIEWVHTHFFPECPNDFFSEPRPDSVQVNEDVPASSVVQIRSNIPLDLIQLGSRWRAEGDSRSSNLEDWLNRFSELQNQRSSAGLRDQNTFFTIPSYSLSVYARANRDVLAGGSTAGFLLLQDHPYVQLNLRGLNTQFDPLAGAERGYNLFALGRGLRGGMTADVEFSNGNFDFSLSEPVWNAINNVMRWSNVNVQINAEWLRYYIGQSFEHEISAAQSSPENLRRLLAENPLARLAYEAQQGQLRTPLNFSEIVNYLNANPSQDRTPHRSSAENSPSWFARAFPQIEVGGNIQIQDYWSNGLLVLMHPHPSRDQAQSVIFPSLCFAAGIQTASPNDIIYLRSHSNFEWDLVRLPGGILLGRGGIALDSTYNNLNFRLHLNSILEASSPSGLPFSILDGNLRDAPEYTETTNSSLGRAHTHHINVPSGIHIQRLDADEYVMSANLHLDARVRMNNNLYRIGGREYQISTDMIVDLHYRKVGNDYYLVPGFNFLKFHDMRIQEASGHMVTQGDVYLSDMHPETHTAEAIDSSGRPLSGFYLGAELTHFFGNIFLPVTSDGLRYDWTTAFSHIDTYWRAWQQNRLYVETHPQLEPNFRFRVQSSSPQTCQRRFEFNFGHRDATFLIPTLHIQEGNAHGTMDVSILETGVMGLRMDTDMEGNWNGRTASIPDWSRVLIYLLNPHLNLVLSQGNSDQILASTTHIDLGIHGNIVTNLNEWNVNGFLNLGMSASLLLPDSSPRNLLESFTTNLLFHDKVIEGNLRTQWSAPTAQIMMGVPTDAPGYSLIRRDNATLLDASSILVGNIEQYRWERRSR